MTMLNSLWICNFKLSLVLHMIHHMIQIHGIYTFLLTTNLLHEFNAWIILHQETYEIFVTNHIIALS